MKRLFFALLLFFVLGFGSKAIAWQNVCPNDTCKEYCANVGKVAYNAFGTEVMRSVKLGKIIGVCWRPKGSLISKDRRVSPRNAFYYIIDDGWGPEKAFLRQCREIKAR
jgi:hypothetical protein